MPHTDKPNQVVGIDYVQVELTKDDGEGNEIVSTSSMSCVCLATDFAQQIRPHRRCWGVIFRMALVKVTSLPGGGGGGEKHVLCGAARFSQKFTLRCAKQNKNTHY